MGLESFGLIHVQPSGIWVSIALPSLVQLIGSKKGSTVKQHLVTKRKKTGMKDATCRSRRKLTAAHICDTVVIHTLLHVFAALRFSNPFWNLSMWGFIMCSFCARICQYPYFQNTLAINMSDHEAPAS